MKIYMDYGRALRLENRIKEKDIEQRTIDNRVLEIT